MKKIASPFRRLFFTKNFIMMLVLLAAIVMAVSAWFVTNDSADASGIYMKTKDGSGIDIARSIKTYNDDGTVKTDGPGEFLSSLEIDEDFKLTKDCTGNGDSLIVPEFNITKDYESVRLHGGKEVNTNLTAANALSNLDAEESKRSNPEAEPPEYQYIQVEFYVRTQNSSLQLNSDSVMLSVTESKGGSLATALDNGDSKRSGYGPFNVDGLVGAMRVSLSAQQCYANDGQSIQTWKPTTGTAGTILTTNSQFRGAEKQLLWVPRPDVYLHIDENYGNVTNWILINGVQPNTVYENVNIGNETYKHSYYRGTSTGVEFVDNDTDSKTVVSSGRTSQNGPSCLGQTVDVADFSNPTDQVDLVINSANTSVTDRYYLYKYTMKIWIEGTDSEARRAMDGGQFKLQLNFV